MKPCSFFYYSCANNRKKETTLICFLHIGVVLR
nr:MAG TPA: Golgi reassembly-stacking protein 1, Golgin fold six-stranded anti parallel-barrel.96A [Caudoviricetes sp.]